MDHNMAGMNMAPSVTSTALHPGSTNMSTMNAPDPNLCKASMFWNWNTINACFISRSWHIRSAGGFAGSCIGVVCLGIAIEFVRRLQRELDRKLHASLVLNTAQCSSSFESDSYESDSSWSFLRANPGSCPNWWQQAVRALLYVLQYAGAYFVMLLAMYYNGYIIICIFIGGFIGHYLFGADTFKGIKGNGQLLQPEKSCTC